MRMRYHIRFLTRQELDTVRWDSCITSAANAIIYGTHVYLDHMAAGRWDALVLGDYEAVMPLTWRRKYGISYLYQPPFTQQTGIFSPHPLPQDLIDAFLQKARQHFRFAEIFLNYGNAHPALRPHANFILHLDAPYPRLAALYKGDLQRNLKHAARAPLQYTPDLDLAAALEGYRRQYAARTPHVTPADYDNFERLCRLLQSRGQLILRAVKGPAAPTPPAEIRAAPREANETRAAAAAAALETPAAAAARETHESPAAAREAPAAERGLETLAAALLLRDDHRLYLLQSTTPPAGRHTEANHFLLDQLIKEFAGSPLTLDLEGSDIPGIAHFYKNFGSLDQPYYFYRHNRLPWFVNLVKSLINHTIGAKH